MLEKIKSHSKKSQGKYMYSTVLMQRNPCVTEPMQFQPVLLKAQL